MDIYDRTNWPSPDANPLVILLRRGDEWYSNVEVVAALGLSKGRALLSNQQALAFGKVIREDDSATVSRDFLTTGKDVQPSNQGGTMRVFNRRALILAAMSARTVNAAAFRDWLADQVTEDR